MTARLAERLTGLSQVGADSEAIRDLLRSYLMLGDAERFDRGSSSARPTRRPSSPSRSIRRSANDLQPAFRRSRRPAAEACALLDTRIVDTTRARLMRTPRTEQVYARLLREAAQNPRLRAVDLRLRIGPGVLPVRCGSGNKAVSVISPAFTREAFYEFVLPRPPVLIREELGIDWVTGRRECTATAWSSFARAR